MASDKEARKAIEKMDAIKDGIHNVGDVRDLNRAVKEYRNIFKENHAELAKHAGIDKIRRSR